MKGNSIRTVAAFLIIGGALGVVLGVASLFMFTGAPLGWLSYLLQTVFLVLFAYTTFLGMRLWKYDHRSLYKSIAILVGQIPVFSLHGITYQYYSAFALDVIGGDVSSPISFRLGSGYLLNFGSTTTVFGLNLMALIAVIALYRERTNRLFVDQAKGIG